MKQNSNRNIRRRELLRATFAGAGAAVDATAITSLFPCIFSRRSMLRRIGLAGLSLTAVPAWAEEFVKLPSPSDPREREITHDFPQKGTMILQRTRPPLLETPMDVFDRGVFTRTISSMCAGIGP